MTPMREGSTISVNFALPMPLFPLDTVALMPQQRLGMHIFEPRYRQMVDHALQGEHQFATATFEGSSWQQEYHGRPPILPAVCVGQIVRHEKLDGGRYNLLLQGVCRARIVTESPAAEGRLYRQAMLEPIGFGMDDADDDERVTSLRAHVQASLADGPLQCLRESAEMLQVTKNPQVPGTAIVELLSAAIVNDFSTKYQLLAEGDAAARAQIVEAQVSKLEGLILRAQRNLPGQAPKGCWWN